MKAFVVVFLVLVLVVVSILLYTDLSQRWAKLADEAELRRLTAEARRAEAEASRLEALTAYSVAEAARARAEGEADAHRIYARAGAEVIEAGAKTVNRQSVVMTFYSLLAPIAAVIYIVLMVITGISMGLAASFVYTLWKARSNDGN